MRATVGILVGAEPAAEDAIVGVVRVTVKEVADGNCELLPDHTDRGEVVPIATAQCRHAVFGDAALVLAQKYATPEAPAIRATWLDNCKTIDELKARIESYNKVTQ